MTLKIKRKKISIILFITLFVLYFLGIYLINISPLSAQCRTGCGWHPTLQICTGTGGCVLRSPVCACLSNEECHSGYCCHLGECGDCVAPGCPAGYGETNTGCSRIDTSCTRTFCTGTACGTNTRRCWLLRYTLTYNAGTGGVISGTTPQSICRGSSGTQVTAIADTGYIFVNWSDGVTTASRTHTNVTSNITVTANFQLSNVAPSPPTSLLCESATNPPGVSDLTPEFSAIYSDLNPGDTAIFYQIQVNTTSDFLGTMIWDSGKTSMSALAVGARSPDISYNGTALSLDGTTYHWRIKFWDNSNVEGPWSSTANFRMNTPPTAPTSLLTEGATNPTRVTDLTPEFSAICNDPDPDNCNMYEIHVNTDSSFTGTVMWNSGQQSMTSTANGARSPDISYNGTALTHNGITYFLRVRFTDVNGTIGPWSSTANFRMNNAPNVPTSLLSEGVATAMNVTDLTPEFSAIFNDTDTSLCHTGASYQIQVNTASNFGGTSMWDSGKISMSSTANGARITDVSYAGTTLSTNGITYFWRIKLWDNVDGESSWSSTSSFTMQGIPTAPTALETDGMINPTYILSLTPSFSAIYNDPNNHNATSYEINVNTNSSFTGTVMWNSGKTSTNVTQGARSPNYVYSGTPLVTDNTVYFWRIRFWDADDLQGPWSATSNFTSRLNRQLFRGLQMRGIQVR